MTIIEERYEIEQVGALTAARMLPIIRKYPRQINLLEPAVCSSPDTSAALLAEREKQYSSVAEQLEKVEQGKVNVLPIWSGGHYVVAVIDYRYEIPAIVYQNSSGNPIYDFVQDLLEDWYETNVPQTRAKPAFATRFFDLQVRQQINDLDCGPLVAKNAENIVTTVLASQNYTAEALHKALTFQHPDEQNIEKLRVEDACLLKRDGFKIHNGVTFVTTKDVTLKDKLVEQRLQSIQQKLNSTAAALPDSTTILASTGELADLSFCASRKQQPTVDVTIQQAFKTIAKALKNTLSQLPSEKIAGYDLAPKPTDNVDERLAKMLQAEEILHAKNRSNTQQTDSDKAFAHTSQSHHQYRK